MALKILVICFLVPIQDNSISLVSYLYFEVSSGSLRQHVYFYFQRILTVFLYSLKTGAYM